MKDSTSKTKAMVLSGLFCALLCVLSPLSLPIGAIPVSLSVFAVFLTALTLPLPQSFAAVSTYLLIGAIGLPVFASYRGGFSVLLGPTGGYILAYPLMVLCVGTARKLSDRISLFSSANRTVCNPIRKQLFRAGSDTAVCAVGCSIALAVCYLGGTLWYMTVAGVSSFRAAFTACVLPFIPLDVIKAMVAIPLAATLRARLPFLSHVHQKI